MLPTASTNRGAHSTQMFHVQKQQLLIERNDDFEMAMAMSVTEEIKRVSKLIMIEKVKSLQKF